jgi:hypothetical protein
MSKAYIKNGTPIGNESLCRTCSYALIFTGYRESEQVTMCTRVHPNLVLPFTINTCSGYYDKNRPSYQQMEDLALDVTPTPLKPVGFKIGQTSNILTHVKVDFEDED